jgi:predicted transcriptional regulator
MIQKMQHSTLQLYIDIIKTLIEHPHLSMPELARFLNVKPPLLKEPISFLTDQTMIKEKQSNSIVSYTTTKKGTEILRFFEMQPLKK